MDKYVLRRFNHFKKTNDNINIADYPNLFNNLDNSNNLFEFNILNKIKLDEYICHIHLININDYNKYINYINIILNEFKIIITFDSGIIPPEYLESNNIMFVNIKFKSYLYLTYVKIYLLRYLNLNSIDYKYIYFFDYNNDIINNSFIKNINRIRLVKSLLYTDNLLGIFSNKVKKGMDKMDKINNLDKIELNKLLNINIDEDKQLFIENNCMILHRNILDYIFKNKIELFYNILNENIDNLFNNIWINTILQLNGNYLILNEHNIFDFYNIKINAIYFPQYHKSEDNDKFWGEDFTEWTLLKPYDNKINITDNDIIEISKPNDDIGYYNLDNKETMLKQFELANKYNINGFVIYHYWFNKNKKVLYKPLEYLLEENITFPFCISWANETWSRRWDGSNNEILILQEYDDYLEHIKYLIPFFKRPNYMKNKDGENFFYIYNFHQIKDYDEMIKVWKKQLDKENLKIKIIITENGSKQNHNLDDKLTKFIFEPMYSSIYCNQKHNINNNNKYNNYTLDYNDIIGKYKTNIYNLNNKHLGLSLNWNNCVRRKNLCFLCIKNFNKRKLEEMFNILISQIIYKYKNIDDLNKIKEIDNSENIIIVNAWNEWNEQAILEPNNITGYQNLETISNIINEL